MSNKVGIQIKRVKALSFFVNESLARFDTPYKLEFSHTININADLGLLFFTIRVFYYYPENEGKATDLLLDMHVQNVFLVHDFKQYLEKNDSKVGLPADVWINIVSLSVSHARAILAQYVAGTVLQDSIFPIMNANDIAMKFFPEIPKEDFLGNHAA